MSVYVTDQSQFPRRIRFDWIGESFSIYGKNVGVWIGGILIYIVGAFLASLLLPRVDVHTLGANPFATIYSPVRTLESNAINLVLVALFYPGLFLIANKQVRGEQISFGDLFGNYGRAIPLLLYHIVFSILLFFGIILCVLPGFVVFALLWSGYALVADGVPLGEALPRAWNAIKQDWLNAGLFGLVLLLLVVASAIPCGLGLFVTIPMLYIVASLMYRDMIGMPGTGADNPMGGPYYATPNTAGGVWPPAPTQGVPPQSYPPQNNPFPPLTNPSNPFPPSSDPYAPPPNDPPRDRE